MHAAQSFKRYRTLSDSLIKQHGSKVFKVPLNAGFSCPNKDGASALKGCIFCSPSGSGDFAGDPTESLQAQYDHRKALLKNKWPEAKTIVYFQANTNTHAPLAQLKMLFEHALTLDSDIVGLSIATRCDALDQEKIAYLGALNKKTNLQIELGLQTIHEHTAQAINRGHDLACFTQAVDALRHENIDVVVHIINGLPGETDAMMMATIDFLNTLDIQGIKIHMLHIMKHTELGRRYLEAPFPLLDLETYVDITGRQIERLNPQVVVHRVTGDSPRDTLIAPLWILKKFVVMNTLDHWFIKHDTYQGALFKGAKESKS